MMYLFFVCEMLIAICLIGATQRRQFKVSVGVETMQCPNGNTYNTTLQPGFKKYP